MLLFFVVVNVGVALLTSFLYILIYFISRHEMYLFHTHIHGLPGYIAGFSVAVKQVMPDHILITSPLGKLRNTHIPLLLLILSIVLRLVGALDGPYPFMFGWGIVVSWVYLRFYQKHSNGNRGDMAENFSFASFFPSRLQPVVGIFANTIFSTLVKMKICKKPQRKYDVSSPTTITITLPGTDPQDAERRRQLALKALNERLSKVDQQPKWPSLVEEGEFPKAPPSGHSPGKEVKPEATAVGCHLVACGDHPIGCHLVVPAIQSSAIWLWRPSSQVPSGCNSHTIRWHLIYFLCKTQFYPRSNSYSLVKVGNNY
ncbi:Transmembrane protein 115 [Acanthosepion pharaonis]|uniref:Transmembrane protein 115 n=1 Tax=Acanthosepion pharaonis TaxID=158019 RepID=A0A812C8F9_ACAPH|nr:Transmembrane protein 115 [Sepia pharaonis]